MCFWENQLTRNETKWNNESRTAGRSETLLFCRFFLLLLLFSRLYSSVQADRWRLVKETNFWAEGIFIEGRMGVYRRDYSSSLFYRRDFSSSLFYRRDFSSSLFYRRDFSSSLFYRRDFFPSKIKKGKRSHADVVRFN